MKILSGVVSLLLVGIVLALSTESAHAESCDASAGPSSSNFHTLLTCSSGPVDAPTTTSHLPPGAWVTMVVCDTTPDGGCAGQRHCPDGRGMTITFWESSDGQHLYPVENCDESTTTGARPAPADILHAFRRIPLPPSTLHVQPPGGATLVNLETNVLTHARPFTRAVTLLGHRVRFTIRPTTFTWHFGDGTDTTTSSPGAAYPDLEVTHRYRTKGTVTPSVDTTWTADYRLDAGPRQRVDGTVTVAGPTRHLTVRTATPVLVGD